MRSRLLISLMAFILALLPLSVRADEANEINLRLFGENVIEGWDGCRFGLWQHNRNPDEDSFAYVFYAPIPDGEALPAWVKIDDQVIEVSPVDIGSEDTGMLEPFRLYRSSDSKLTVLMEISEQLRSDRGIEIDAGRLTFLRQDKFPFSIRVRGLNGCTRTSSGDISDSVVTSGSGLTLGEPENYDSLDRVPPHIMRAIASEAPECAPETTAGYSSAYHVSDEMMLWEVPCNLYATHGSSVFAINWTNYPGQASVLLFPSPPDMNPPAYAGIQTATVYPATATVTSVSLDSGRDCGSYESFQLQVVEGEAVEFVLQEYRNKSDCDGIETNPAEFPLVYDNR